MKPVRILIVAAALATVVALTLLKNGDAPSRDGELATPDSAAEPRDPATKPEEVPTSARDLAAASSGEADSGMESVAPPATGAATGNPDNAFFAEYFWGIQVYELPEGYEFEPGEWADAMELNHYVSAFFETRSNEPDREEADPVEVRINLMSAATVLDIRDHPAVNALLVQEALDENPEIREQARFILAEYGEENAAAMMERLIASGRPIPDQIEFLKTLEFIKLPSISELTVISEEE